MERCSVHQTYNNCYEKNRANKTYTERLGRWLHRISHFDVELQLIVENEMMMTDYLSRHLYVEADIDINIDQVYVNNALVSFGDYRKGINKSTMSKNHLAMMKRTQTWSEIF